MWNFCTDRRHCRDAHARPPCSTITLSLRRKPTASVCQEPTASGPYVKSCDADSLGRRLATQTNRKPLYGFSCACVNTCGRALRRRACVCARAQVAVSGTVGWGDMLVRRPPPAADSIYKLVAKNRLWQFLTKEAAILWLLEFPVLSARVGRRAGAEAPPPPPHPTPPHPPASLPPVSSLPSFPSVPARTHTPPLRTEAWTKRACAAAVGCARWSRSHPPTHQPPFLPCPRALPPPRGVDDCARRRRRPRPRPGPSDSDRSE